MSSEKVGLNCEAGDLLSPRVSREIAIIVPEQGEIPADPHVSFDPAGINLYAGSWRVEMGA